MRATKVIHTFTLQFSSSHVKRVNKTGKNTFYILFNLYKHVQNIVISNDNQYKIISEIFCLHILYCL